jgi:hypothetical protein
MWGYRFTLRDTNTGTHTDLASGGSYQFADQAFKAGWDRFYSRYTGKPVEVVRCIVYRNNL